MKSLEFLQIVNDILINKKFNKLKNEVHHYNSNRYDHCLDVSYKTYLICKKMNLDYVSATRAALLHDFFFTTDFKESDKKLFKHPSIAYDNALSITSLNEKEINIIKSHMYPIGGVVPRSTEAVIVDAVDDFVAIKEKLGGDIKSINVAFNFLLILFINFLTK